MSNFADKTIISDRAQCAWNSIQEFEKNRGDVGKSAQIKSSSFKSVPYAWINSVCLELMIWIVCFQSPFFWQPGKISIVMQQSWEYGWCNFERTFLIKKSMTWNANCKDWSRQRFWPKPSISRRRC